MNEAAAVSIRRVGVEDAERVAELNGQLGYPTPLEEVRDRIAAIQGTTAQAVFVACLEGEVVGWVNVAIVLHLQSRPFALTGGLVVKDGVRAMGIGKRLCGQAEEWAREQGVETIRVTSRSTREEAHRFYLRDGY